jgi:DNA polymerase-3 subunit delta
MARAATPKSAYLVLICGDDDFAVKRRAKDLFATWGDEVGGMDQETIDATVSNSGEAVKVLGRLREALQTLPFFGTGKVVWLQNCNFLGDERAASAQIVTEHLASLTEELKSLAWDNLRLLISAGKVDKRKVFYKTLDKLGQVESFAGWSIDDRDWSAQAEVWVEKAIRARDKEISEEALAELVARVGPNARQLESEAEKITLYVGQKPRVEIEDVAAVCSRNKAARAFALSEALGDRDLPRLLRCLDQELWEVKLDPNRSEIGLLYGIIAKVRAMILLKEMVSEGWVKPEFDYNRFKSQLERVPQENLPRDRRFNPLALNAYVLYKALPQIKRYTQAELVAAMDLMLKCNQRLVSSAADESLVLQQTLVQIVGSGKSAPRAGAE